MENKARFYDAYPNKAIRERANTLGVSYVELAAHINDAAKARGVAARAVTSEAIRQWVGGYSQPKYERLQDIMKVLDCSLNFLFGIDELPSMDLQQLHEATGLSEKALQSLNENEIPHKDISVRAAAVRERAQLVNCILESQHLNKLCLKYVSLTGACSLHHMPKKEMDLEKEKEISNTRNDLIDYGYLMMRPKQAAEYYAHEASRILETIIQDKLEELLSKED